MLLEARLIRHYDPPYNVRLRHDKHFPFIAVVPGPAPAHVPDVVVMSGLRAAGGAAARRGGGARAFGPFPQGREAARVLAVLDRALRLRELRAQAAYGNDPAPYLEAVEV